MTKAADRLSVSQSSVSRFIGLLEDALGTGLFLRRDGLSLTPCGAQLAEHLNQAFRIIERGVQQVARQDEVLRVKVSPSLAMRWLLKQAGVPDGVRFYPRWRGITPDDYDFEIGIRYGQGDWPADHAQAQACSPRVSGHQLFPELGKTPIECDFFGTLERKPRSQSLRSDACHLQGR